MKSKNTLVRAVCLCSTLVRTCLPCCLPHVHRVLLVTCPRAPRVCVCVCVCVYVCVCMDDVSDHPLGVCAMGLRQGCVRKKYARVCMGTKIHIIDIQIQ